MSKLIQQGEALFKIIHNCTIFISMTLLIACTDPCENYDCVIDDETNKTATVEIANNILFIGNAGNVTGMSLEGTVAFQHQEPTYRTSLALGLGDFFLTSTYVYSADGSRETNNNSAFYNSVEGSEEVFFVEDNKVYKIDNDLNVEELNFTGFFDFAGQNATLRKALVIDDSLLVSYKVGVGFGTVLIRDNISTEICDTSLKQVSKSKDNRYLFVLCVQGLTVFDNDALVKTIIPMASNTLLFSLSDKVYYRWGSGYFIFNESSFSFDEIDLFDGYVRISDVESHNGIDYVSSDNTIWLSAPNATPRIIHTF